MMRGAIPTIAVLVGVAGVIGVIWGQRAVPPTETEIIEAAAAAYVEETGGVSRACYARPSALADIRLVVICDPEGALAWVRAYDDWGREVALDAEQLAEEPQT